MNYVDSSDWSIEHMLYRFENFNGWGYHFRKVPSPYLWSFSNHYKSGKFTKDGVFDPSAVSRQVGAAVLLKQFVERRLVNA
jgi:lysozyme family protein